MELESGMRRERQGPECWDKKPMRAKDRMTERWSMTRKKYQGPRDEAISVRAREQNKDRQTERGRQIRHQRIGDEGTAWRVTEKNGGMQKEKK